MIPFVLIFIVFSALSAQATEVHEYVINDDAFKKVKLRTVGDIQNVLDDLEYPENEVPKVFLYDFNNDENQDYLIQSYRSLCGNGGCIYEIIDGKTGESLGQLFGRPLIVLREQGNKKFPDFQSYAHLSANCGELATYKFVGKKYKVTSRKELRLQEIDKLFLKLRALPSLKGN